MQEVTYDEDRTAKNQILFGSNGYDYRLDLDWARWPSHLVNVPVLNACTDDEDNLFVSTEDRQHPVAMFDRSGAFVRSFGGGLFTKNHSIWMTPQGTLLCADTGLDMHVVREITTEGELVRDLGTLHQPGQTGYRYDIKDELDLVALVPAKFRSIHDALLSARVDTIERRGEPFCRPTGVTTSPSGDIFITDGYGNAAIHKFAPTGQWITSWGEPGRGPGQFRLPHNICIDALGRVWVADRENHRAQIFTQEGELLAILTGGFMKVSSFWADDQHVYVGEQGGFSIVDLEFNLLARIGDGGSLLRNNGMSGDSTKNLYICSNLKGPGDQNLLRMTRI